MREICFDIEADGLHDEITQVWCAVFKELDGTIIGEFLPDTVHEIPSFMAQQGADTLWICHNAINYDFPVALRGILGVDIDKYKIFDTLIASQMLWPDRPSHSLESFAGEFGYEKVQNEDWSQFTEHMLTRCKVDVDINIATYEKIRAVIESDQRPLSSGQSGISINWEEALELEFAIAKEVSDQGDRGCPIDVEKLDVHLTLLQSEIAVMFAAVTDILGTYVKDEGEHNTVFLASGGYRQHVINYWEKDSPEVSENKISGPYSRLSFEKIKLSQHGRVKQVLLGLGWNPSNFTEKGSPKLPKNEEWDEVATSSGNEELSVLATYGSLKNRLDILSGWKGALRDDNTIRHGAFTCGTPTARFRHQGIVNIPRVTADGGRLVYYPDKQSSVYGTEMRELIHCPQQGWKQVGWDLAGIELRMLAHYMNNEEFFDVILDGDVHTFFWSKVKDLVASRSDWKNVFYGYSYGAGNGKLGSLCTALPVAKRTAASGKTLRDTIESSTPSLGQLVEGVQAASLRGYIRGIDGRKIFMKTGGSKRKIKIGKKTLNNPKGVITKDALNRLLQSGAAIVFKKACVLLNDMVDKSKVKTLIYYHDETQAFVQEDYTEEYSRLSKLAVKQAGEHFKLNIRLDADTMIGNNWAECH